MKNAKSFCRFVFVHPLLVFVAAKNQRVC